MASSEKAAPNFSAVRFPQFKDLPAQYFFMPPMNRIALPIN
jgi:hypothetical protein